MEASPDTWTTAHDLSLVYVALAYGTDHELADEELDAIVERLSRWNPPSAALDEDGASVQEIVMEAMAIYLEEDGAGHEVAGSVETLGRELDQDARCHALEDAMRIAEADGVLLSSEQNLITALADAWSLREAGRRLIDESSAQVEAGHSWSLLHDLGLVYVVVAHSTDEKLSEDEIAVILERIQEWHDEVSQEDAREVMREVLAFYSEQPSEEALGASVRAIKETLPAVQRLVALNDLTTIAAVEGDANDHKREMIEALAEAWEVPVQLGAPHSNGKASSSEAPSSEASSSDTPPE
jgi:uncharacterized tellurite resistance protein B-like protein